MTSVLRGCVAVALVALLLVGCGGPAQVTLETLVDEQEDWSGRQVVVEGVVAVADDPRHHWVEDGDQHRVELIGVPGDQLDVLLGRPVRVGGRFDFTEGRGRTIDVDQLDATG